MCPLADVQRRRALPFGDEIIHRRLISGAVGDRMLLLWHRRWRVQLNRWTSHLSRGEHDRLGTRRAGDALSRHCRGAGKRRSLLVGRFRRCLGAHVRDGITQEDFVTFYETCKKAGPKIRVAGVRLDAADGAAIVSMEVGGTERPRIMLFENGNWVMKPTPGFAAHLGEPVEQIVAEEKSAGLCSN